MCVIACLVVHNTKFARLRLGGDDIIDIGDDISDDIIEP